MLEPALGKLHNFSQMLAQQLPVNQPRLMADGLRHEESSGSLFSIFILSMTEEEGEDEDEEEDKDEEEASRANCTWLKLCLIFYAF